MKYDLAELMKKALEKNKRMFKKSWTPDIIHDPDLSRQTSEYVAEVPDDNPGKIMLNTMIGVIPVVGTTIDAVKLVNSIILLDSELSKPSPDKQRVSQLESDIKINLALTGLSTLGPLAVGKVMKRIKPLTKTRLKGIEKAKSVTSVKTNPMKPSAPIPSAKIPDNFSNILTVKANPIPGASLDRVPYGGKSYIGYHATSVDNLKSISRNGLNNQLGRELGAGLDNIHRGVGIPAASNWASTKESALDFGNLYGQKRVLLLFNTKKFGGKIMDKSNRIQYDWFTSAGDKSYIAIPKAEHSRTFSRYRFFENREALRGVMNSDKKKFDWFDVTTNKPTQAPSSRITDVYPGQNKVDNVSGGSSSSPIRPEDIYVSFDEGKSFFKIKDIEFK